MRRKTDGSAALTGQQKRKKILFTALKVIFILLILLVAAAIIAGFVSDRLMSDNSAEVHQIAEIYPTLTPFPADFDTDISTLEEYMSLGTGVMYKFPDGNSFDIADIPDGQKSSEQKFFADYFDVLKKGDYKRYPSLFTEKYKRDPVGFEKDFERQFPPQKVYDIIAEELYKTSGDGKEYTYDGEKCDFSIFRVSYRIYRNDGYFRPDLYDESLVRPLYFELVTFSDSGKTFIKNLYTETSIAK